jgi:deoxyribose-phosphate aldolase
MAAPRRPAHEFMAAGAYNWRLVTEETARPLGGSLRIKDCSVRPLRKSEICQLIDHTHVRAQATQHDIARLCGEAAEHRFASVCVNPAWTAYCAKLLARSSVRVCPTVGFPLGASTARIKVEEAREAVRGGAAELDMVINIGALKSGFPKYVEDEIAAVVKAVKPVPVKVILETCYLTAEEKVLACQMSVQAGAAFVKTSTGFANGGATLDDVALMRKTVGKRIGVKASGGIREYADAMRMIEAGANRLGTSAGPQIMEEAPD